jgi:hypothetical protein
MVSESEVLSLIFFIHVFSSVAHNNFYLPYCFADYTCLKHVIAIRTYERKYWAIA